MAFIEARCIRITFCRPKLDLGSTRPYLEAEAPRVRCKDDGVVRRPRSLGPSESSTSRASAGQETFRPQHHDGTDY